MPNIENNTMSTFTLGGKTFEVKDTSARTLLVTINTEINEFDQRMVALENGNFGLSDAQAAALVALLD